MSNLINFLNKKFNLLLELTSFAKLGIIELRNELTRVQIAVQVCHNQQCDLVAVGVNLFEDLIVRHTCHGFAVHLLFKIEFQKPIQYKNKKISKCVPRVNIRRLECPPGQPDSPFSRWL